jgi:recombination protein RecT
MSLPVVQQIKSIAPQFEDTVRSLQWRMKFEAEARFLMAHVANNDDLASCDAKSFGEVMLTVASLGVSLNPALKHAYVVPYKRRATLAVSYMGLASMAMDDGCVQWLQGAVVREGDEFEYERGLNPVLRHKPAPANQGPFVAAYCVWQTADGTRLFEVMEEPELQKVRKASKAPNSPAWSTWGDQMRIKAVIKRASKLWKKSDRFAQAVAQDDRDHGGTDAVGDDVMTISIEQAEQITSMIPPGQKGATLTARICAAYDIASISDLPAESFETVVGQVKAATEQRRRT